MPNSDQFRSLEAIHDNYDRIKHMSLTFPNPSRSLDAKGNRVRFWGYDRSMEISFFIEAEAIRKLSPPSSEAVGVEGEILSMFDTARKQIYKLAEHVYSHSRQRSHTHILTAEDI